VIRFVLDAKGRVAAAAVASSTLPEDSTVATCIAEAAKHWNFPKLGSGSTATVTYPFVLGPG
jgi:hypothetical protein